MQKERGDFRAHRSGITGASSFASLTGDQVTFGGTQQQTEEPDAMLLSAPSLPSAASTFMTPRGTAEFCRAQQTSPLIPFHGEVEVLTSPLISFHGEVEMQSSPAQSDVDMAPTSYSTSWHGATRCPFAQRVQLANRLSETLRKAAAYLDTASPLIAFAGELMKASRTFPSLVVNPFYLIPFEGEVPQTSLSEDMTPHNRYEHAILAEACIIADHILDQAALDGDLANESDESEDEDDIGGRR